MLVTSLTCATASADVEISCFSETWPAHLQEEVSVWDLTPARNVAQIVVQLPIRTAELELEGIQLRRFDHSIRTLWIGLSFKELDRNRARTSIEVRRSDLDKYKIVAFYRNVAPVKEGCASYEWVVDDTDVLREKT